MYIFAFSAFKTIFHYMGFIACLLTKKRMRLFIAIVDCMSCSGNRFPLVGKKEICVIQCRIDAFIFSVDISLLSTILQFVSIMKAAVAKCSNC